MMRVKFPLNKVSITLHLQSALITFSFLLAIQKLVIHTKLSFLQFFYFCLHFQFQFLCKFIYSLKDIGYDMQRNHQSTFRVYKNKGQICIKDSVTCCNKTFPIQLFLPSHSLDLSFIFSPSSSIPFRLKICIILSEKMRAKNKKIKERFRIA